MPLTLITTAVLCVVCLIIVLRTVKIVPEGKRLVLFRLGRVLGVSGPGVVLVVPLIDRGVLVSLEQQAVSVSLGPLNNKKDARDLRAEVLCRVTDPVVALVAVADYHKAVAELTKIVVAKCSAESPPDRSLLDRERCEQEVLSQLAAPLKEWGVAVERVDLVLT